MKWLDNIIGSQITKRVQKELKMRGWITKTASVGGMLISIGSAIIAITNGDFDGAKNGAMAFMTFMAALGIGRKIDVNTNAVEKQKIIQG